MTSQTLSPRIALVGNPNAGKSALFNALTGAHQRTGNYPGVTVERKSGRVILNDGTRAELVDLPGTYSLDPHSPDERVTRDVVMGEHGSERRPDALIIVVDAGNLAVHLRFAIELLALSIPCVIALNMVDMAARDGLTLDPSALERALGVPVIPTVAVRRRGLEALRAAVAATLAQDRRPPSPLTVRDAHRIADAAILSEAAHRQWTRRIDRIVLHPLLGTLIFFGTLFLMFQAVFSWATVPQGWITAGMDALAHEVTAMLPPGLIRSALVDGVLKGVGAVLAFIPQIMILFAMILVLESTGYMVRAAFLIDKVMSRVGLSGRAFIPLLSSFACAVPGIMATRTIEDPKDRLTTMLIAPLMTCSARWPVYVTIIAAFIPNRAIAPGVGLQGLVMFGLVVAGMASAMLVALVLRRTVARSKGAGFLIELPKYQWPVWHDIGLSLWQRLTIFLKRAGTLIAGTSVLLWLLLNIPRAAPGQSQVDASLAGHIANGLNVILAPIGFNREISLALIPAMAAREVAVSSLATAYAVSNPEDTHGLGQVLAHHWSLPTALAFLAWFVFAPQCMSTIAVVRRETNGWRWPLFMLAYLFVLAYGASGATYLIARLAGL